MSSIVCIQTLRPDGEKGERKGRRGEHFYVLLWNNDGGSSFAEALSHACAVLGQRGLVAEIAQPGSHRLSGVIVINIVAAGGEEVALPFAQLAGRIGQEFVLAPAECDALLQHSSVDRQTPCSLEGHP